MATPMSLLTFCHAKPLTVQPPRWNGRIQPKPIQINKRSVILCRASSSIEDASSAPLSAAVAFSSDEEQEVEEEEEEEEEQEEDALSDDEEEEEPISEGETPPAAYIASMFDDPAPSSPDYADEMNFSEDPAGHKSGFVAIIGRPNAGKSTLLNAILGQTLSVVTSKAQTTRHRILGVWSEPSHQVVFLDTPGIIADRRDELEERMMGAVESSVRDSDVLLAIVDASKRPRQALDMIQPGADWAGPPMAVLLNKADLLDADALEELMNWFQANCRAEAVFPVSALQNNNLKAVTDWVLSRLPEGPSYYPKDFVAEAPERFFVAEIIRGQIFQRYREELPYQVAVEVVEFKERRPPAKALVRAHVLVEKKRHVGMLLGAGGAAIKGLSTAARIEVEEFLQREVYLDLSVKVAPGWRSNAADLERLGHPGKPGTKK